MDNCRKNEEIPLELRNFEICGIVGCYKYASERRVKRILKKIGYHTIILIDIGSKALVGCLVGGSENGFRVDQLQEFWQQQIGYGSFRKFACGKPVNKQLTTCGYPVDNYKIIVFNGQKRKEAF